MYQLAKWEFNEEVSGIFDEHIRQSIPNYDSIQNIIYHLSDFFIKPNSVVYDLGCSTGETISHISLRHKNKNALFIGIDESLPMIQKAIEKNKYRANVNFVHQSIENYLFKQKSDLILSVLTIQFMPIESRERMLSKIYKALNQGGGFVFVEKSYPESPKAHDMFTQIYHDYKEEHGLSAIEIREKDKSLRSVLTPLSVEENVLLLKSLGFKTVEVFFKYLNFTGFIAIK